MITRLALMLDWATIRETNRKAESKKKTIRHLS